MSWFGVNKKQTYNCHFCCKTTTSPKFYKQGWICPDPICSQYNGFNENGDYNLNIINEFTQNHTSKPSHCKPANIPFKISNNVFQSKSQFNPNSYIPSTSGAPLCYKCQQNENKIQSELQQFDAGANSNYNAYIQYRRLLEDKYPLCHHCKTQCQYRLNIVNHNARLWQKYEDSLSIPNLDEFIVKSDINSNNNYCCSSFIRCIMNTIIMYLSLFISIIGLSNGCATYLETPTDIINKCKIQWNWMQCQDVSGYFTPCIYIQFIKNEMEKYVLTSNYIILSGILLIFIFALYDKNRHRLLYFILFLLSSSLLILIPIISLDIDIIPFMDEISVILQILMFLFCLLFITRSKYKNTKQKQFKYNNYNNNIKNIGGNELLNLLEEQDKNEANETAAVHSRGSMLTSSQNTKSQSTEEKEKEQTFFPPFQPNKQFNYNINNGNAMNKEWSNVQDPFQGNNNNNNNNNKYNAYNTKPINPFYGHYINNNKNRNNNLQNNGFRMNREPMDICSPRNQMNQINRMNNTDNISPNNFHSVRNGIDGLDLNHSF